MLLYLGIWPECIHSKSNPQQIPGKKPENVREKRRSYQSKIPDNNSFIITGILKSLLEIKKYPADNRWCPDDRQQRWGSIEDQSTKNVSLFKKFKK